MSKDQSIRSFLDKAKSPSLQNKQSKQSGLPRATGRRPAPRSSSDNTVAGLPARRGKSKETASVPPALKSPQQRLKSTTITQPAGHYTRSIPGTDSRSPDSPSRQNKVMMSASAVNMLPPHDKEEAAEVNMNNAQMWASLMSKLNSMQDQQAEALKSIKEEIQVTNSNFSRDISHLRGEVKDMKSQLHAQESKWEEMGSFKQIILDEVKDQIAAQVAVQVKDQLAARSAQWEENISGKIDVKVQGVEKRLEENISGQIDEKVQGVEERLEDDLLDFQDKLEEKTESTISKFSQVIKKDSLKEKYENRRRNLILMGLEEQEEEGDEQDRVVSLLKDRVGIQKPKVDVVYRLGATKGGRRPRPVMITFSRLAGRKAVWYAKSRLNEEQEQKLRLQEDIPQELRWELNFLLKILRHAKSKPESYPNVKIKDYKLIINGYAYGVDDEDILPDDLHPSAIATPQSADAVAFFGRDSPFSNHFICDFESGGLTFVCLEQYLACHKAKLANNRKLTNAIMRSSEPSDHKRALNAMKDAVPDEWKSKVEDILLRGLKAKFGQNEYLKKLLIATHPRKLGEASRDPVWGTGFHLKDDKVLDVDAWKKDGNLLGRSLEKIREEFLQEQLPPANSTQSTRPIEPPSVEN